MAKNLRRGLKLVAGWTLVFFVLLGALQMAAAPAFAGEDLLRTLTHLAHLAVSGLVAGVCFTPLFLWLGVQIGPALLRTALAVALGVPAGMLGMLFELWLSGDPSGAGTGLWIGGIVGTVAGLCSGLAAAHWSRPLVTPRDPATPPVE